MTDWIDELRAECERTSQSAAAQKIGYSVAVVNRVIRGVYKGDLARVEQAVRGALMGATVDCPVVGEIPRHRCIDHQRRAKDKAATNPMRVQLAKACQHCPQSYQSKGGRHG